MIKSLHKKLKCSFFSLQTNHYTLNYMCRLEKQKTSRSLESLKKKEFLVNISSLNQQSSNGQRKITVKNHPNPKTWLNRNNMNKKTKRKRRRRAEMLPSRTQKESQERQVNKYERTLLGLLDFHIKSQYSSLL